MTNSWPALKLERDFQQKQEAEDERQGAPKYGPIAVAIEHAKHERHGEQQSFESPSLDEFFLHDLLQNR